MEEFILKFDSIFNNKEVKETFIKYLSSNKYDSKININNIDQLNIFDFIIYLELNKEKNIEKEIIKDIFIKYFNYNSEKLIKTNQSTKEKLIKKKKTIEDNLFFEEKSINEFFEEIKTSFLEEINYFFPSFIKSKFYKEIKDKLDKNLFEKKKEIYLDFKNRNIDELDIREEDFEFFRELEKESKDWDLLTNFSPTLNLYYTPKQVNTFIINIVYKKFQIY
jgi:hypothetical protein